MQLKNDAFDHLPFSKLFKAYQSNFSHVADFYETDPHHPDDIKRWSDELSFEGDRQQIASILQNFNAIFEVEAATFNNIKRLRGENALAIVTGQQLGVYGGPLYTIYKTLTTIYLARKWEEKLGQPVVPIFWLADEDHDYEEIQSVQIMEDCKVAPFALPDDRSGQPVSALTLPEAVNDLSSQLQSTLLETDFSDELWQLLDQCFKPGKTFRKGFGDLIAQLFSKYGLVLAGSHDEQIKDFTSKTLAQSVSRVDELRSALEDQSRKIEERFHQQASVYDSHLFYLHPQEGRTKIRREEDAWLTDTGQQWSAEELQSDIEAQPELFSPDVFLRPILQDRLLPTLGYVAGPGEIAYYGQMKRFYHGFDQSMPVIFPRMSATLVEPAIARIFGELPFEFSDYQQRIEDLESQFAEQAEPTDIEALFDQWKQKSSEAVKTPHKKIKSIDETLDAAVKRVQATYFNELDNLKGKVYRAIKKDEQIQLKRIRRIQCSFFPERNLQERSVSAIYFMNKFGLDIWDRLLEQMEEGVSLDAHTLIHL